MVNKEEPCFFCKRKIDMKIEHFFKIEVKNRGGEDHKEKRLMCYECESHLKHYRNKQDASRGNHDE